MFNALRKAIKTFLKETRLVKYPYHCFYCYEPFRGTEDFSTTRCCEKREHEEKNI